MAEFKTRLFIFCAGRLLKWAESIEQEIEYPQSRPTAPVDDDGLARFAESSREGEAAPGPPEHWARLVRSTPPQHWLDLIRERAPQLLPPADSEALAAEAENVVGEFFNADTLEEVDGPSASEDGALETSQPQSPSQRRRRRSKTQYPSTPKQSGATWLKRLRFQPPRRQTDAPQPPYVSNEPTRHSESFPAAGRTAAGETESTLQPRTFGTVDYPPGPRADQPAANAEQNSRVRTRSHWNTNEAPGSERRQHQQGSAERSELLPIHSEAKPQKAIPEEGIKQSRVEQFEPHRLMDSQSTRLHIPLEQAKAPMSTTGRRAEDSIEDQYVDSPPRRRAAPLNVPDRVGGEDFAGRDRSGPARAVFPRINVSEPSELNLVASHGQKEKRKTARITRSPTLRSNDGGPNARYSARVENTKVSTQPSPFAKRASFVTRDERATNEFSSADFAVPTTFVSRLQSGENVWPTLPPPPEFDIADELAAREHETEVLRRLEQEQRGTLWNG